MSHNLIVAGGCPWQTDTETTEKLLANLAPGTVMEQDFEVIERLRAWAHASFDPKPLIGKDARNPYLVNRRNEEIEEIDYLCNSMRDYILNHSRGNKRLTDSN